MAETLAQRLLAAAHTDPGLLTRLRVTYRGTLDVLDALWWRVNPLLPTPEGRGDPALKLADLQAHVYSRHVESEPIVDFVDPFTGHLVVGTERERELRRLSHTLAQNGAALDVMLERMRDWSEPIPADDADAVTPVADPDRSSDPSWVLDPTWVAANSGATPPQWEDASPGPPPPRTRATAATFLIGAVIGLSAGVFTTMGIQATAGAPDSDRAGASSTGTPVGPASDTNVLRVFDDPAQFPGGTPPDLGPEYPVESIRSVFGPAPAGDGFGAYVARRGTAQYCIVVTESDRTGSSACSTKGDIERSGLHLKAVVSLAELRSPTDETPTLLSVFVSWLPDGSIVTGSTPVAQASASTRAPTNSVPCSVAVSAILC